jgi:hypothetical protein
VVAIEDGPRAVPRYLHRHPLWHPGIDHVPYRRAADRARRPGARDHA